MFKKILVPLDGSALAEEALPYAEDMARTRQSEIFLFRVAMTNVTSDAMVSLEQGNPEYRAYTMEIEQPIVESVNKYLDTIQHALEQRGLPVHKVIKRDGHPASAILSFAQEAGIELIVMSTHGRSGLNRLIYGSVTERVLRGTGIPVLVVPSGGWKSLHRV
ncbi:MAG: universal stress protein [Acidobacteria bacterium]|nr:universal stress protein [Acidobacteriota bacterium]